MPEAQYDEIWMQVREHTYTSCTVFIAIGPIDTLDGHPHWDVRDSLNVLRAAVSFTRHLRPTEM
jgi:hypothetical protein